jgi:AcrR family transcriptional regulator
MASVGTGTARGDADPAPPEGRVARNRRRRSDAFLAAGLHIVTEEGIEALTMARLAAELDTAPGAVYRYFASKQDLMAAIEASAIGQLQRSHDASVTPVAESVGSRVDDDADLVRLVVLSRWLCAAAALYPEEVRLLQLVSSRRTATLTPDAAQGLAPTILALVAAVSTTIDAASRSGAIGPGDGLARAIMWLTAFGGVSVADDLEEYVPSVLGGGRLARQLNVDLLVGWGAAPDAITRIDAVIDAVADDEALAR